MANDQITVKIELTDELADAIAAYGYDPDPGWRRTEFTSVWNGPNIELIVVQNCGSDESWSWTARGWRQPDDCDGVDKWGWVNTATREACEAAALAFYLEKDE